ncbi:MAG: tetratricopeptide repeat protein [Rhizobiales bacterium]|nr:tetratricopeptide repeat protein [Hyphomicrobiales bacterium]
MPMSMTAFALALIASPAAHAPLTEPVQVPVQVQAAAAPDDLAAQPLAQGRTDKALAMLEQASIADPHDAGVLINLGIAYAQMGDEAKARTAFEQALACHEVVELETADGSATDSRRLARKAIKMLERGEFRAAQQFTYRD